jgi:hypothetical protein
MYMREIYIYKIIINNNNIDWTYAIEFLLYKVKSKVSNENTRNKAQ